MGTKPRGFLLLCLLLPASGCEVPIKHYWSSEYSDAKAGDPEAMWKLGSNIWEDYVSETDSPDDEMAQLSIEWWDKGARAGYEWGTRFLAGVYLDDIESYMSFSNESFFRNWKQRYFPTNRALAREYFEVGGEAGDLMAQSVLAKLHSPASTFLDPFRMQERTLTPQDKTLINEMVVGNTTGTRIYRAHVLAELAMVTPADLDKAKYWYQKRIGNNTKTFEMAMGWSGGHQSGPAKEYSEMLAYVGEQEAAKAQAAKAKRLSRQEDVNQKRWEAKIEADQRAQEADRRDKKRERELAKLSIAERLAREEQDRAYERRRDRFEAEDRRERIAEKRRDKAKAESRASRREISDWPTSVGNSESLTADELARAKTLEGWWTRRDGMGLHIVDITRWQAGGYARIVIRGEKFLEVLRWHKQVTKGRNHVHPDTKLREIKYQGGRTWSCEELWLLKDTKLMKARDEFRDGRITLIDKDTFKMGSIEYRRAWENTFGSSGGPQPIVPWD